MKNRIIAFLLCASLAVGLVACGNNSKSDEGNAAEVSASVNGEDKDSEEIEEAERTLEGAESVDAEELEEKEEISADEITKTESKPEIVGDDTKDQSVVKSSAKTSKAKVKKVVKKAKKAYADAQAKAKKVATSSDSYAVYVDSNNCIREMIAYPKLYGDMNSTVRKAKAYFYYSVKDGFSTLRFVYIKKADGGEVRFYLAKNKNCPYACYRFTENGKTKDYPKGVNPEKVSPYGAFCSKAYMEPHWFGQQ